QAATTRNFVHIPQSFPKTRRRIWRAHREIAAQLATALRPPSPVEDNQGRKTTSDCRKDRFPNTEGLPAEQTAAPRHSRFRGVWNRRTCNDGNVPPSPRALDSRMEE